jgi:hypothetical protein
MESIKQHSTALFLIGLLVIIKFALLPVLQWQENTIASNALLEKRLVKSAYAIANKEQMQSTLTKSSKQLSQLNKTVFNYQATNNFKLAQQKQLESLFEQHKVAITSIVWQAPVPLNQWQLNKFQIQLRVKGTVTAMQKIHAVLESQPQWIATEDYNFRVDKRRQNRLGKLSGRIALNYFVKMKNAN